MPDGLPLPIGLSVDSNEHWEHIHFHTLSYYTGLKVVFFYGCDYFDVDVVMRHVMTIYTFYRTEDVNGGFIFAITGHVMPASTSAYSLGPWHSSFCAF